MKPIIAVLMLLAVKAAAAPVPKFTPGQLALPPLSLGDAAKAALPPAIPETAVFAAPSPHRTHLKPRMRIIEPRGNPDPRMALTPNPAIDYKLRIVRPSELVPRR